MLRIPLDQIEANPRQPRHDFDEQALQELAQSIRLHDIIQPVTVSKLPTGKYRLVSGERRYRAAKIASERYPCLYPAGKTTSSSSNWHSWRTCNGKISMPWRSRSATSG